VQKQHSIVRCNAGVKGHGIRQWSDRPLFLLIVSTVPCSDLIFNSESRNDGMSKQIAFKTASPGSTKKAGAFQQCPAVIIKAAELTAL